MLARAAQALKRQTRCRVHVFDPLVSFQQQLLLEKVGGLSFLGYGIGPSDGSLSLQDPRQGNPATNFSRYQAKSLSSVMLVRPSRPSSPPLPCPRCCGRSPPFLTREFFQTSSDSL